MDEEYGKQAVSTGDLARDIGLQRYQLEYLIETGAVPDTALRVAGNRVWSADQVEAVKRAVAAKKAMMVVKKED